MGLSFCRFHIYHLTRHYHILSTLSIPSKNRLPKFLHGPARFSPSSSICACFSSLALLTLPHFRSVSQSDSGTGAPPRSSLVPASHLSGSSCALGVCPRVQSPLSPCWALLSLVSSSRASTPSIWLYFSSSCLPHKETGLGDRRYCHCISCHLPLEMQPLWTKMTWPFCTRKLEIRRNILE